MDGIYGNGRSICTKIIRSPNEFVDWLDELIIALELESGINVMGHSYGGWLTSR